MISRRDFLGTSLSAGAALALARELLRASEPSAGALIQRAIPSTGEMLPAVSCGAAEKSTDAEMKEILKTLHDHGGRVVDGSHGGGVPVARKVANELDIQNKFFWITPGFIGKAEAAAVRADLEAQLAALKAPSVDLVMVSTSFHVPTQLAVLKELKKEGRVRHIGVRHLAFPSATPFGDLESLMRNEPIDFVATDYSAADRRAEEKILPLAQERRIAFMAYFVFNRGRLFTRVGTTPLPEWAAEFDAKSWPQFLIKYVLSHPGVTVARTGTTKAAHMLENIGGGIGRLPNEATRARMAALIDALPKG
jgi:aryl-alcohol dehydrogenase-like predicted oxidoreductase